MKIIEIYDQYKIMPNLQVHQLRVAAVAKIICDNFTGEIDTENVVSAALLHDMGNIIKFNLSLFPEFLEPEGLDYWQSVKDEYHKKYGDEEHEATEKITEEIVGKGRIFELVNAVGFSKSEENFQHSDFAKKIAAYSDHRVSPFGVMSLRERILGGRKRFATNKGVMFENYEKRFHTHVSFMEKIENQIFEKTKITPDFITDKAVNSVVEELRELEISNF